TRICGIEPSSQAMAIFDVSGPPKRITASGRCASANPGTRSSASYVVIVPPAAGWRPCGPPPVRQPEMASASRGHPRAPATADASGGLPQPATTRPRRPAGHDPGVAAVATRLGRVRPGVGGGDERLPEGHVEVDGPGGRPGGVGPQAGGDGPPGRPGGGIAVGGNVGEPADRVAVEADLVG